MSTSGSRPPLQEALASIPANFRTRIIDQYVAVKRAQVESRFESLGLSAGKLCESVIRLLQHEVHGQHTAFGRTIKDFANECRLLVTSSAAAKPESLRVTIPRALVLIYTMRNKRGIGHIGGDVDANEIDAATMARLCDWVICELVRVYHGMSLEEAQDLVDGLAVRTIPEIWHVGGKRRVLKQGLSASQKVLLLCHQSSEAAVFAEDLFDWIEYSNLSVFKARVLRGLHEARMIEFDASADLVTISPLGIREVEEQILAKAPH